MVIFHLCRTKASFEFMFSLQSVNSQRKITVPRVKKHFNLSTTDSLLSGIKTVYVNYSPGANNILNFYLSMKENSLQRTNVWSQTIPL